MWSIASKEVINGKELQVHDEMMLIIGARYALLAWLCC